MSMGLLILLPQVQAATLLCGDEPCEEADTKVVAWPAEAPDGVSLRAEPKVLLNVPDGYEQMRQYNGMISYLYPTERMRDKTLFLFSITINNGDATGPVGGWDALYRTEKDGLVVYFFQDPTGEDRYTAIVRNTAWEENDPFGRVIYLQLSTIGFTRGEFLQIVGSVRPVSVERPHVSR